MKRPSEEEIKQAIKEKCDQFPPSYASVWKMGFRESVDWLLSLQPEEGERAITTPLVKDWGGPIEPPQPEQVKGEDWERVATKFINLSLEKDKTIRHVIYEQKRLESELAALKSSRLTTEMGWTDEFLICVENSGYYYEGHTTDGECVWCHKHGDVSSNKSTDDLLTEYKKSKAK